MSDLRASVRGILASPRDPVGLRPPTFPELEPVRRREEVGLELEGNANCISSWGWYAGELDFQRRNGVWRRNGCVTMKNSNWNCSETRRVSDLVRQRGDSRIVIANCISCGSWYASMMNSNWNWRERELNRAARDDGTCCVGFSNDGSLKEFKGGHEDPWL